MLICKNCGTKNSNRNVCQKCGAFLYKKNTIREKDPAVLKKMRREKLKATAKTSLLSLLVLVLTFIVLSVVMFFLFRFVISKMEWPTEEELLEELEEMEATRTEEATVTVIPPQ